MQQVRENLYLIDIDQALEGFRKFISAWLYRIDGATVLVDPGPASTIPYLVEQLKQAGVNKIDHILLTHIHLDHAGGTGHLQQHFPGAKINCHPKGIPHMVAPQKLWEESKKVLGKVAEAYGEMAPVPESNISYSEAIDVGALTVEVVETPGHAAHHVSYRMGDILFAGEVCGVYVPLENGFYVRPATPPPFQHRIFRDSIAKAAALDVSFICLGHYGCRQDATALFERARRQLDSWVDTVERHFRKGSDPFEETVLADLIATDPDMSGWQSLPKDIQARERHFCFNSIRGIRGYLMKK
ncbi:MAG TPA: MBL fold metallo-hydrolase [Syntrophales bacterium]|nr:MBL fold metallo-hydrolase [Syntrophales bacterium]